MDKFLETYSFLRPNREDIENRLITSKEIDTVIKQNKTKQDSQQATAQHREFHWQIL